MVLAMGRILTLDLPPATEKRLRAMARLLGRTPEEYALDLLLEELNRPDQQLEPLPSPIAINCESEND